MGQQHDPHSKHGLKITPHGIGVGSGKIEVTIVTRYSIGFILLVSLFTPLYARAGVFSFFADLFSSDKVEADGVMPNSQNMALLQASLSPDPSASSTEGDVLIVDGSSLSPETQSASLDGKDHSMSSDQISIYVVRKGDTLPAIAKMFGVSVNTIVWANDLKGRVITPDQTLVILPISGVQHIVKKGDSLKSITKQYKADLDEILQYNNLTLDSKLAIGDEIVIPDGEITPQQSSVKPSNTGVGVKGSLTPTYNGYYMRPIIGGIKTQGIHGHNGVDLASSYGSNILAAASGKVLIAKGSGWNGGYGSYVVISHANGTQTLYGHLSSVEVSAGDNVSQGQVIGHMGSTGKSTGVHLHFEIRGAKNPF